jgi:adenylylsulfate kinase-like enzyme
MSTTNKAKVVPVLNIIGPVGIGKSSVADEISEILSEESVPHAIVDLDHVRRSYPYPEGDSFNMAMGFKNLAAVWANYSDAGARCLIIPSVMEGSEDFEKIRLAVPGAEMYVVRLEASLDVNHARIRGREKTAESLEWHLNRSSQLSRELREKQLEHATIDTESKAPREIAAEILAKWNLSEQLLAE